MKVNNINDQLDATITILLIFETARLVSGSLFPIFRSVRLWFTAVWCIVLMLYRLEVRSAAALAVCCTILQTCWIFLLF